MLPSPVLVDRLRLLDPDATEPRPSLEDGYIWLLGTSTAVT